MANDLVLDTAIRDWVLVPLSLVMVLIGVLRHFVSKLMRSTNTPDLKALKEGQIVIRARYLRAAGNFIPAKSFKSRRNYYNNEVFARRTGESVEDDEAKRAKLAAEPEALFLYDVLQKDYEIARKKWTAPKPTIKVVIEKEVILPKENGLLHVPKGQAQNMQAQMFSDPNMAMDMMKKNLSMIIPQTLTFAWVNFFFSGFVAAKIPFPLTQRFRPMLQNGIDLSSVDVSYVSSRSWYFLNLFGLRGFFSLILGEENATDDTQKMMQMGGQMGGFGVDPSKTLSAEKDGLELIQHDWALPKIEHEAESVLRELLL